MFLICMKRKNTQKNKPPMIWDNNEYKIKFTIIIEVYLPNFNIKENEDK